MMSNPIHEIRRYGQSVWLDYIRRALLTSGEFEMMVKAGEITGLTSNPAIFRKAIAGSIDYDEALATLIRRASETDPRQLYEALLIEDIQKAADLLRPVYDETSGLDGYACLEVSPKVAHDTAGTIAEARRLFSSINRPNVMIEVPATRQALPAIASLIGEGINVNVTLMFSIQHFEDVAEAYLAGLETLASSSGDLNKVASVASFFISRIDAAVDKLLPAGSPLRGRAAIAHAKTVYARYREVYSGGRFAALKKRGAHLQRLLWASTGVKNPHLRDVLYMEELIGPDTVMTVPPATLDAFRDHGRARPSLTEDLAEAFDVLDAVKEMGVDLSKLASELETEGVASLEKCFDSLMIALARKRDAILAGEVGTQHLSLGRYEFAVGERLKSWAKMDVARRIWSKDPTVWVSDREEAARTPELADRLGWLGIAEQMEDELAELTDFAREVRRDRFSQVVLLGMGGSSLAPEVLMATLGSSCGYPPLTVLDSTHPSHLNHVMRRIDLARTLFVVSSKSGTTTETMSFFKLFYKAVKEVADEPGKNFVVITDPGSPLEALAEKRKLRRVFTSPREVGGRYSALTYFGLVPAALIGADLHRLLDRALTMGHASHHCVPIADNPSLALGVALGELALAGRDKVTLVTSPSIASFGSWVEQLIAESTGKNGKGVLPIAGERVGPPEVYGSDRLFVYLRVEGDDNEPSDKAIAALEAAGQPVVRIRLDERENLGAEFFRWEMATAAAGAVLGINPFDQPDVEAAKIKTRDLMKAFQRSGVLPAEAPAQVEGGIEVYGGTSTGGSLDDRLTDFLGQLLPGDYVALIAYIAQTPQTDELLGQLRLTLRDRLKLATVVGYGPRYLHSTGQLFKGGDNRGVFILMSDTPEEDIAVPEEQYTFGTLIAAQALGDYQAMGERGRRLIRFHFKCPAVEGLKRLRDAVG